MRTVVKFKSDQPNLVVEDSELALGDFDQPMLPEFREGFLFIIYSEKNIRAINSDLIAEILRG